MIRRNGWRPSTQTRRRIRRRLAHRDGYRCIYCQHRFADDLSDATIDHCTPLSAGGTWKMKNLCLACEPCNRAKGNQYDGRRLRRIGWPRVQARTTRVWSGPIAVPQRTTTSRKGGRR
jgi:5-methylcytosine-specific restriction endonuclease McrA